MSTVSKQQLQEANDQALLSGKAAEALQQAGSGLVKVYEKCKANTAGLEEIVDLMHVTGYITDAVRALLERETLRAEVIARLWR